MSFPKVVNDRVGFGNDALPVKPFHPPLARTTKLASVRALKPMTARIGLTFVLETVIGISFFKHFLNNEQSGFAERTPLAHRRNRLRQMITINGEKESNPG